MEHSGLWGHPDHGMTTEDSSGCKVGPAEFRTQTSCTMDGHLSSFQKSRGSLVDPKRWILSDLQSSVLICSYCDCIPVLLSWSKKVLLFILQDPTVVRLWTFKGFSNFRRLWFLETRYFKKSKFSVFVFRKTVGHFSFNIFHIVMLILLWDLGEWIRKGSLWLKSDVFLCQADNGSDVLDDFL